MSKETPSTDLLPCPFCGCAPEAYWRRANPKAMCRTEGCMGAKLPILNLDQPDAIAAWNRRATDRELHRSDVAMPVVAYLLVDKNGRPQHSNETNSCWISEEPSGYMSQYADGCRDEPLVKQADAQAALAALKADHDRYARMFNAACTDLGSISEAFELDPDDGGAGPILLAIEDLHAEHQVAIAVLIAERDALRKDAERLTNELMFIANADVASWDDPSEFKAWAQNRARAAMAKEVTK